MTQSMEANNESSKKKDKLRSQIKEFQRDLRRLMVDVESKQGIIQVNSDKSHIFVKIKIKINTRIAH